MCVCVHSYATNVHGVYTKYWEPFRKNRFFQIFLQYLAIFQPTLLDTLLAVAFSRHEGSLAGIVWKVLNSTHASFFDITYGPLMLSSERGFYFWE